MHSYKKHISILAVGLAILMGLGLSSPVLRISIVQFSMGIATSPEEPPREVPVTGDGGTGGGSRDIAGDHADEEPESPEETSPEETPPQEPEPTPTPTEPIAEPGSSVPVEPSPDSGSLEGKPENKPKANLSFVQKPSQLIESVPEQIPPQEEAEPPVYKAKENKFKIGGLSVDIQSENFSPDQSGLKMFLMTLLGQILTWLQILEKFILEYLF